MNLTIILFGLLFLVGCIPPSAMLKTQNIQAIEAGFIADSETGKILSSNQEVDSLANGVVKTLELAGFRKTNQSVSFGLLPATGHTQNLGFYLVENEYVQAYVEISKSSIKVIFREMEMEHGASNFTTSEIEREMVRIASATVSQYLKSTIGKRSIRIVVYDNP